MGYQATVQDKPDLTIPEDTILRAQCIEIKDVTVPFVNKQTGQPDSFTKLVTLPRRRRARRGAAARRTAYADARSGSGGTRSFPYSGCRVSSGDRACSSRTHDACSPRE